MTMKEADIDQNGIQTEACLCTNRFKCLLYYFCFGRIDNSTRFCYFFIGVSTPGKNRTQFIDQYNTTANKRISYSSRLFEVTCCRIKIVGVVNIRPQIVSCLSIVLWSIFLLYGNGAPSIFYSLYCMYSCFWNFTILCL